MTSHYWETESNTNEAMDDGRRIISLRINTMIIIDIALLIARIQSLVKIVL